MMFDWVLCIKTSLLQNIEILFFEDFYKTFVIALTFIECKSLR